MSVSKLKSVACAVVLAAALGACELAAEVTTSISAGGRASFGFVLSFDKQLLDGVRRTPQGRKALDDLNKIPTEFTSSGWTFRKSQPAGGLRFETRRRFSTVRALNQALEDVRKNVTANSSATIALASVFKQFEVQRTPGFLKSETRISGLIEVTAASLTGGTQVPQAQLQGLNDLLASPQASQLFKFRVRADLAGKITSSTGDPQIDGASAVWKPRFGQPLSFSATASSWNPFVMIVGILLAAAVVIVAAARVLARRRPRRTVPGWEVGAPVAQGGPGSEPGEVPVQPADEHEPSRPPSAS